MQLLFLNIDLTRLSEVSTPSKLYQLRRVMVSGFCRPQSNLMASLPLFFDGADRPGFGDAIRLGCAQLAGSTLQRLE